MQKGTLRRLIAVAAGLRPDPYQCLSTAKALERGVGQCLLQREHVNPLFDAVPSAAATLRCTQDSHPTSSAGDEEYCEDQELTPEQLRRAEVCERWQAAARSLMSSVHMVKHAEMLADRFAHPADRGVRRGRGGCQCARGCMLCSAHYVRSGTQPGGQLQCM